jgi:hypothetical protein
MTQREGSKKLGFWSNLICDSGKRVKACDTGRDEHKISVSKLPS